MVTNEFPKKAVDCLLGYIFRGTGKIITLLLSSYCSFSFDHLKINIFKRNRLINFLFRKHGYGLLSFSNVTYQGIISINAELIQNKNKHNFHYLIWPLKAFFLFHFKVSMFFNLFF